MLLLLGMIAAAMTLSSFCDVKNSEYVENTISGNWRYVGQYKGCCECNKAYPCITIYVWEMDGLCGSYYWTSDNNGWRYNPDEAVGKPLVSSGKLMSRDGKWYAAYNGDNYYIDF